MEPQSSTMIVAKKLLKAFDPRRRSTVESQRKHDASEKGRGHAAVPQKSFSYTMAGQVKIPEEPGFLHILEYLPKPVVVHKASMVCKHLGCLPPCKTPSRGYGANWTKTPDF
jgi:Rieske Fe-S protein